MMRALARTVVAMTSARDLLERFRPAGTPGAAARAGVPADRARSLREELQPVLDLLEPTEAECDGVRARGAELTARVRRDAATRAASTLATARTQAEAARAEAAAGRRRRSDAEAARELEAAHLEAADVVRRSLARTPALAARVRDAVVAELTATTRGRP
jgi:hypothetical protein